MFRKCSESIDHRHFQSSVNKVTYNECSANFTESLQFNLSDNPNGGLSNRKYQFVVVWVGNIICVNEARILKFL